MLQEIVVAAIVIAAAVSVLRRQLKKSSGCGNCKNNKSAAKQFISITQIKKSFDAAKD